MSLEASACQDDVDRIAHDLCTDAEAEATNSFVLLAESGELSQAHVTRFLLAECAAQDSERAAFEFLAARFPSDPAGTFFLQLAGAVRGARARLAEAARAVGVSMGTPRIPEVSAAGHAFCGYLCWLAMRASQAGAALAMYADFIAWCGACARIATAMRKAANLPDSVVAYFEGYARVPEALGAAAAEVVLDGLANGDDPVRAEAEARLVLGYLEIFWNSAAAPLA